MSEAFWWYVLAGFLLGFSVSTLWEWVYFRRRRMNIRDRRIAELEATVRAYTAAANVPNGDTAIDDWAEPTFQSPGVYLETEEAPPSTPAPESPAQNPSSVVVTMASHVNGALSAQPASGAPAAVAATSAPAGFQSLAVQHSPFSGSASMQPETAVAAEDSGKVSAAPDVARVVSRAADDTTTAEMAVSIVPGTGAHTTASRPEYFNRVTGAPTPSDVGSRASRSEPPAITSAEIGVLVSSINELIDTVSQEPRVAAGTPTPPAVLAPAISDDPYVTRVSGRAEYVLVRIVQSFVQFIRQLRQIITGAEAPRPVVRPVPTVASADDLTRIAGLSNEHAARLRAAGVTTYARLAALSPDELRRIALKPGDAAIDPVQWQTQAQQLAVAAQQGGEPA
jgi:hypothetical protein